ncbi:MAG TPA: Hsp20/alpha crystallin family protein [Vicinamibacterales bacterium]|nr:Hsp20/alpha crystallin family protein [Vicinamibacterales bacterium]
MLSLTRWNPFEELSALHRDVDRLFNRFFNVGETASAVPGTSFAPAAEVVADKEAWRVRLALPGIDPKDVQIECAGNALTVRGERRQEEYRTEPFVSEITYGRFERTFTLPETIDSEKVTARYANGMLELTLPLKESVRPRRIEIQTAPQASLKDAA